MCVLYQWQFVIVRVSRQLAVCVICVCAEHPDSSHRCPLPTGPNACFHRSVSEHQLPEAPHPHNWRESSHLLNSERLGALLCLPLWLFFFCSVRVSSFCRHWGCQQDGHVFKVKPSETPTTTQTFKLTQCGAVGQKVDEDGHLGLLFQLVLTQTTVSHLTALSTVLPRPGK